MMDNNINIQDNELLVHKIGNCITASLKPTDYFVGYAPFVFNFVIEEFKGETLFSEKITPIEQAIVGILTIDETASIERIGAILGFNVMQDTAEYNILSESIKLLSRHKVIEGDDSMYCLTEEGKVFATEGKRPEKDNYNFKLWYSKTFPQLTSLKELLNVDNIVEEEQASETETTIDLDIIRNIASKQAPKVHNPSDERILSKVDLVKSSSYSYILYVCFIKNVFTGEIRTIAYDESQDIVLDDFSSLVNNNEVLKAQLFDSIVESVFIPEEALVSEVEVTKDADDNEIEVAVMGDSGVQKLRKKALYDEIAFENELEQIFNSDKPDEVWLISPWIGYFFVQCRVPMIEKVLKEGAKVFIAYSKKDPRDKNHSEMVNPLAQKEIDRLLETYSGFYCVELPKIFHTKNVLEVKRDQVIMFSGSFNILSFAIQESHKIIRGEQMAFVNPQKAKSEYRNYIDTFAEIYQKLYKSRLSDGTELTLQELKGVKLKYFTEKSSKSADIEDILDLLDEKLSDIQRNEWLININKLHKMVTPLLARGIITGDDKKYIRKELTSLEESAKILDLDEDLMNNLYVLLNHLDNLKVRKNADKITDDNGISVSNNAEDYTTDIQSIISSSASGRISIDNIRSARKVLKNKKFNTDHQLVRYLVSLNLMIQATKNKMQDVLSYNEINSCAISLIERTENKAPNLSIFIQGDVTYFDLAGIQISLYKMPHTDKTSSIIASRDNMVFENKRLRLFMYADEIFNLIFNRN